MKKLWFITLSLILHGCSTVSSHSEIRVNDVVVLNQDLIIKADDARVSIQSGKVVSYSRLDNYYPHCWFISWQRKNEAQTIKKDIFTITNVKQTTDYVKQETGGYRFSVLAGSTGITAMEYFTELDIYSDKQPEIKKLICSHWEDPDDANHLTLNNIQKTLGSIASIRSNSYL